MSRENLVRPRANPRPPNPVPETPPPTYQQSRRAFTSVTQLGRRPSLPLAQLSNLEAEFFELIEDGNRALVEKFLNEHRDLNVNCVNYKGQNALSIAIKQENEEIVKMLFNRADIEVRDAALLAVDTSNIDLATVILDAIKDISPELEKNGCPDSADYSPDITPIMLAAHNGDYKMVRLLLERGHVLEKPHNPDCLCSNCKKYLREEGAAQSRLRLNAYRGVCNPAHICQVTDDPILYGFIIDSELKQCALIDKEFRSEYGELGDSVREFTVNLLSQCRNTMEIEMLLHLPFGFNVEFERAEFPRLQLAVDYHQKEFVAHSMVQQVLTAHWLGEYRSWPRLSLWKQTFLVAARVFLLPVICIALMVTPKEIAFTKKYRSPLNRFLLSLSSFIFFMICVFLINYLGTGKNAKGPPSTGMEGIIVFYVLGFIWSTIKRYWVEGARRFFSVVWNWYDITMETCFILTFMFWSKSYFDVQMDHGHKKKILDRKFWHKHDSTLLHEGFLAIATVLTFGKLAYYCLQSSRLGPLQVSLGKMAVQIVYFLALCLFINTAFAIPLTRMYAYYDGMTQTNAKGETRTQLSSFSTISNSFLTLFWGMFGMSPVESTDIVIENLTEDKKNPVLNSHDFTERVGLTLFAVYELMMIIALVNTLIAILSNTFQRIIDNADVEFKFARTKLWMYFFDDSTTLPSPFNLCPTMSGLVSCGKFFKVMSKKVPGASVEFSFRRCCYIEYKDRGEIDTVAYTELISNLVQRYFSAKDQENEEE